MQTSQGIIPPLAADERPAAIRDLRPAMRVAVVAAAAGLKRLARGWHATGHPAPISQRTVEALAARGLLLVGMRTARLSHTGKWYARTLITDQLATEREQA